MGIDDKAFHKGRLRKSKDLTYSQFSPLYTDPRAKELYTGIIFSRYQSVITEQKTANKNYLHYLKTQGL